MTAGMEINKIYCENNLETMKRMPDNFVDLVVTSPPYDNLRTYKGFEFPFEDIAKELFRVTQPGGVVVWVVGDATVKGSETGTSFRQALYFMDCGFNLHDTMIYERSASSPANVRYEQDFEYMFILSKCPPKTFNPIKVKKSINSLGKSYKTSQSKTTRQKDGTTKGADENSLERLRKSSKIEVCNAKNIWRYDSGYMLSTTDVSAFEHPAIYPEQLAKDHIYSWSNEGDLVYDPFMGSGTTAKMAHLLKRNWIGSEISQEYVDLANKRLQPYLNQGVLNL